jgi:uncharacterized membrane protein YhhN
MLAYYLRTVLPTAQPVLIFPVLAILFGWIGDILLLKRAGSRFFVMGLAAFLLGHICYILSFCSFGLKSAAGTLNMPVLFISIAAAMFLGTLVFWLIKPDKPMRIPTILYEVTIEMMAICALQLMLFRRDLMGSIIFGGAFSFLVSDTLLARFRFRGMPKYGNIPVMFFYILAQGCIVFGLANASL